MAQKPFAKQENTKKEIEAISERIKKSKLQASDLVIPLSIGLLLILLTIFVFVPMVSSALDYQRELKEIEQKREKLQTLEAQLNKIDEIQISEDVLTAKKVIPKVLKVSDFIYYVDYLAKEKGLSEKELSAGDTGTQESSNVSGPIEYSGPFDIIISFLEDVQKSSPYLINLKNVDLTKSGDGIWNVSVQVSGYYISEGTQEVDLYSPFSPYTSYTKELEVFKAKANSIP